MKTTTYENEQAVTEFEAILQASPLLWEAYIGLPNTEREKVKKTFLDNIWGIVLSAKIQDPERLIDILGELSNDQ